LRKAVVVLALTLLFLSVVGGVFAYPWHVLTFYERWREKRTGCIYYSGNTDKKLLALTFDDGPDPRYTPEVLHILRKHHIHATFFVIGNMLAAHPSLGRQEVLEGNVVGNHSQTRAHLEGDQNPQANNELSQCEAGIEKYTGDRTYLFRPPRGLWNRSVFNDARSDGYRVILWSLAFDREAIRSSGALRKRVVRLAKPGDIILLHDGAKGPRTSRAAMVRELDATISGLEKRGFRFVTVPEMLKIDGDKPIKPAASRMVRVRYSLHHKIALM